MAQQTLEREAIEQMTFGEMLRELRRRRDWSIQKLSDATEIDVAYLSRLENGRKDNPTGPLLASLADALDLTGAERFFFFCKAMEAKYGQPFVFGPNDREARVRIYDAVSTALNYGNRLLRGVSRWLGSLRRTG